MIAIYDGVGWAVISSGTTITITEELYVSKAGDAMEGELLLSGAPESANAAATKAYVDSKMSSHVSASDPHTQYARVTVGTSAPASPSTGDIWVNTA